MAFHIIPEYRVKDVHDITTYECVIFHSSCSIILLGFPQSGLKVRKKIPEGTNLSI